MSFKRRQVDSGCRRAQVTPPPWRTQAPPCAERRPASVSDTAFQRGDGCGRQYLTLRSRLPLLHPARLPSALWRLCRALAHPSVGWSRPLFVLPLIGVASWDRTR